MLVRLTSSTSGEIIMFAQQARRLFEIMGKECTARGVITTEQIPQAITSLHRAVEEEKQAARRIAEEGHAGPEKDHDKKKNEEESECKSVDVISLGQRAHPLIQMMQWTQKEEGFVLWRADRDF